MNISDVPVFQLDFHYHWTDLLRTFGYFFYVMNPKEHVSENVEGVRDYFKELTPLFSALLLAEFLFAVFKKDIQSIRELLAHVGYMVILELSKIPLRVVTLGLYVWVFTNFRFVTLPWDSPWTWILGLVVQDFWYYWMHRMSHQINILWAIHETHHAPERITMPSSMSLHVLQSLVYAVLLAPTATLIPPTVYLVHVQMCFVCQIWVHTEGIGKLPGIIEYIFNTPSHHRVHHGRNRKYIDKNFGAYFIIWDRMFGTYEEEDPDDLPAYGSSSLENPINIFKTQTGHFRKMWKLFWSYEGLENKLSVIFKGPGWSPGKPWTGDREDIPQPPPELKTFRPDFAVWFEGYVGVHGLLTGLTYLHLLFHMPVLSKMSSFICSGFLMYSCIVYGYLFDSSKYNIPMEIIRCLLSIAVDQAFYPEIVELNIFSASLLHINRIVFNLSIFIWISIILYSAVFASSDSKSGETKQWTAESCYSCIKNITLKCGNSEEMRMREIKKDL